MNAVARDWKPHLQAQIGGSVKWVLVCRCFQSRGRRLDFAVHDNGCPQMVPLQTMITATELSGLLERRDVKVLDASWYLPTEDRCPRQEFAECRIPESRFFDIDRIADPSHSCPHMLPSARQFAEHVEALGVGSEDLVVLYDRKGLFSAPRAWWMFRVFGHDQVRILVGGFNAWRLAGLPTESGEVSVGEAGSRFRCDYQPQWVADKQRVQAGMGATGLLTLDARSPARFAGEEPEPRPGVRPGHIPGSRNLHYAQVVADGGQGLKSEAELKRLFADVGIDQVDTVITTCGSGISACILALALHEIGRSPISVYDGSWAEWGADLSCQVEKG